MSAVAEGPGPRGTAAAVAVAVLAALAGVATSLWAVSQSRASLVDASLGGAVVIGFAVVGAVVAAARPRNRVGWFMLLGGVLWSLGSAATDLATLGIVADPGRVPGASAFAVAGSSVRATGWYLVTVCMPLVFPDGRLAGRRWRWLAWASVVVIAGGLVGPIVDPQADLTFPGHWRNPLAGAAWMVPVDDAAVLLSAPLGLLLVAGAVAQLVVRWRRGGAFERQQIGLFAAAAAVTVIAAPVAYVTGIGWAFSAAALPLPFAIGFAVLARGLYDLRTAVNRTLLWATALRRRRRRVRAW